jgi:hypothetical protein
MRVLSQPRFTYPNFWKGQAWCDVDVYRADNQVLVLMRDHNDHGGTSLTNAQEDVATLIKDKLLKPHGLARLQTTWVAWSRIDRIASRITFKQLPDGRLDNPQWRYLSPEDLKELLTAFGGAEDLKRWIASGEIVLRDLKKETT